MRQLARPLVMLPDHVSTRQQPLIHFLFLSHTHSLSLSLKQATHLRILRMRRVIRILCLLRNQRGIELLVPADIAWIDVLSRLAIRALLDV